MEERLYIPGWLKLLTALFVVFIAAAIAFAVLEPIQVLPRMRLAPGYSLTDQDGERFTSETVRGDIVVYAFTAQRCGSDACDDVDATMADVGSRLGDTVDFGDVDVRLVSVVLDGESSSTNVQERSQEASVGISDDIDWSWLTGDEATISTVVGTGFGRFVDLSDPNDVRFDPGFVIVDGNGVVRGDYRYQTLADDADKLVRHLDILAAELRHTGGAGGIAYEAAHLFLCYP